MSKLNTKDVTYACLHGPIFLPGLGQFGPTLVAQSPGKHTITKMEWDSGLLLVSFGDVTVAIPSANVTHTRLS